MQLWYRFHGGKAPTDPPPPRPPDIIDRRIDAQADRVRYLEAQVRVWQARDDPHR